MCGVAGIASFIGEPIDVPTLRAMGSRLHHRGPDGHGVWVSDDRTVGLTHRRLAILDLSDLGRQPMVSEDGSLVITYNGEIYNFVELRDELTAAGYHFRSRTDTEVILAAYQHWGAACVDRLWGMFAFVIHDLRSNRLFLARDRLGIKPLYYFAGSEAFVFASRPSSLVLHPNVPLEPCNEGLSYYFEVGFIPAPWTALEGVRKLEPGRTLVVDLATGQATTRHYWDPNSFSVDPKASMEDRVDELDRLLSDAVRRRLVADVPVGAFLSGGLDSATIVSHMTHHTSTVRTFTVGFDDTRYDESSKARRIAEFLGTDHIEVRLSSDDLLPLLDDLGDHYDEPMADWSSLATTMVSRIAREHVTVCLSGDGGDEQFGGYPYYSILQQMSRFYRLPRGVRNGVAQLVSSMPRHRLRLLGAAMRRSNAVTAFAFMRSMIKDAAMGGLLTAVHQPRLAALFETASSRFPISAAAGCGGRLDLSYYLPDDILQKVDLASMSVGLEARVPLLDHRIVEFSLALPEALKIHRRKSKRVLRGALARHLPSGLTSGPKRGFEVPLREWFRGPLKEMVNDELSPGRIDGTGILNSASVGSLLTSHMSGVRDTHPMLWVILTYMRWRERLASIPADRRRIQRGEYGSETS
jgi:asparagine synthase (glutamine-hydrolysing)